MLEYKIQQEQIQKDRDGQYLLANITTEGKNSSQLMKVADELRDKCRTVEEDDDELIEEAWGDVFGASLGPKEVKRARKEEIDYIHKMSLYSKVPIHAHVHVTILLVGVLVSCLSMVGRWRAASQRSRRGCLRARELSG